MKKILPFLMLSACGPKPQTENLVEESQNSSELLDPICTGTSEQYIEGLRATHAKWMEAVVKIDFRKPDSRESHCSGSMIGNNIILSAGHCYGYSDFVKVSWPKDNSLTVDEVYTSTAKRIEFVFKEDKLGEDIALYALPFDAPVTTHFELDFNPEPPQEDMVVMGHPKKSSWMALGARGLSLNNDHANFTSDPCFAGGLSGAGIVNDEGKLWGITITGAFNYDYSDEGIGLKYTGESKAVPVGGFEDWIKATINGEINRPPDYRVKSCATKKEVLERTANGIRVEILPDFANCELVF